MNDKIIIKAISKTYFVILSLLTFIFLTFTFVFIMLQNGIHIKELSIFDVKIEQLYIKWDERIDVSLKDITIISTDNQTDSTINYKVLSKYLKAMKYTVNWFDSIVVENIEINDIHASFKYTKDSQGFVLAKSPSLSLSSSILYNGDILNITLENFTNKEKEISINGNVYLDLDSLEAFVKLNLTVNNDANLTLYSKVDTNSMDYAIQSKNNINNIKHIITLASLPKAIKFWTHDAISLKSMEIQNIRGGVDFQNVSEAYKNIYVKAIAHQLDYTYNVKLDSIHTQTTDLEFKNGVLYIRPQNAYSYKTSLDKSWLKIDFTQKEELLTLHLLFDGQLDKDMLNILNTYKIKLPFLQKKGSVSTDLIIAVNLMSIDVDAKGSFFAKKANFDYLGLNIDIFDTKIFLNNYDVKIDEMRAKYKDIASADVKVVFNAKESQGKIDFLFDKIALKQLSLKNSSSKLSASYTISPEKDIINVQSSSWIVNKHKVALDAVSMPFNLKTLDLTIPTTYVKLQDISSGLIEGKVNLKSYATDLSLDVLDFSYEGIKFSQSNTPFTLKYSDKFSISSKDDVFFSASGTEYVLSKPSILLSEDAISLKNAKLKMGHYASTKIYAKYDFKNAKTHVSLSNFLIQNYKKDKILYRNKKILLSVVDKNNSLKISSRELGATLTSTTKGWKVYINSIAQISKNSELLQQFHLEKGNFTLYKNKGDKYAQFMANVSYPYQILTDNAEPTKLYKVKGKLKQDKVSFTINKNTKVNVSDTINIKTTSSGINVNEIMRFVGDMNTSGSNQATNIKVKASDSYLYLSDSRKVIFDSMNLQYVNNILTAQLKHAKGEAGLRFEENKFHLYGKDFNDDFMENLLSLSKFKGGTLDFSMDGTVDEYSGVFYIYKSTIMDYILLNNILAFINTVPSLVTFSLPGYSNNGLFVNEAYVNFNSKNNIFNFQDIYLESKELTILGNGKANFKDDTIDVNLNLKTDLGSNASKIPLVGYILFDDESMSTTLKIQGKVSNPQIESRLAKDIVVAPLNIIKRTFSLPYNLFKSLPFSKSDSE